MKSNSLLFWPTHAFSLEELYRTSLMAECIHLPNSDLKANDVEEGRVLQAFLRKGRLQLTDSATLKLWSESIESRQDEYLTWSKFFAHRICEALATGKATVEFHEVGHRISFAWDDGSGVYPADLFPRRAMSHIAHFDMRRWDQLEDELLHSEPSERFGANDMQAEFAISVGPLLANSKLLLDRAIEGLGDAGGPHTRLAVLGTSPAHLRWMLGTYTKGPAYEPNDVASLTNVLDVVLGRPTGKYKLSSIPVDRFLGLSEDLGPAREAFTLQMAKWSETLVEKISPDEQNKRLAALKRNEILPAIEDFNRKTYKSFRSVLGAVSGSDLGKFAVAAFSMGAAVWAGASSVGSSPQGAAVAGLAAAASGVAGSAAKYSLEKRAERSRTWMAFADALSDELDQWSPHNK